MFQSRQVFCFSTVSISLVSLSYCQCNLSPKCSRLVRVLCYLVSELCVTSLPISSGFSVSLLLAAHQSSLYQYQSTLCHYCWRLISLLCICVSVLGITSVCGSAAYSVSVSVYSVSLVLATHKSTLCQCQCTLYH